MMMMKMMKMMKMLVVLVSVVSVGVVCARSPVVSVLAEPADEIYDEGGGELAIKWNGKTAKDLHREYGNIFKYGNRNAASHLWSTFLLERASNFDQETMKTLFSSFCAISGSPVRANDYNRYRLKLQYADEERKGMMRTGYMHYCCWPCIQDVKDFLKTDTLTLTLQGGVQQTYHFAVMGDPCKNEKMLDEPFVQPFDRRTTTLRREARELRCQNGRLAGATMSDGGYVIIGMFFDLPQQEDDEVSSKSLVETTGPPQPGRLTDAGNGVMVQDEYEWGPTCEKRAANGYNSGMGEIFRKVAAITRI